MLEKLILGVVVGILKFFADRHAVNKAAKAEVYRELWANAKRAYEWETTAAAAPDGGATLRVSEPGHVIQLQSDRPEPPSRPAASEVLDPKRTGDL